MNKQHLAEAEAKIRERYNNLRSSLNERARRLFVATEANAQGYGGIAAASRATGMARSVIAIGISEIKAIEENGGSSLKPHRSRRPGGGRKKKEDQDLSLVPDLKEMVESTTRGDPESPLLWTARSLRNLSDELQKKGHDVSYKIVERLLKQLGYSLQSNRKRMEGAQHPDRNVQFEHINETTRRQLESGNPVISVDAKKKELVGPYKNAGKELRPKHDPEEVNVYDFVDKNLGRATPYGVLDLNHNEAWVSVGISHDTAAFSVEAIRKWWNTMGVMAFTTISSLLIIADGGGSNGYRLKLWKVELQHLADELGVSISVCHLPPGTSKWNKIEHRLFSFITQNWRGKPLISHQVIVNLIASTKTKTGLKVQSAIDENHYPKGKRVSDEELAKVYLEPHTFHGEWNYTIHPSSQTI